MFSDHFSETKMYNKIIFKLNDPVIVLWQSTVNDNVNRIDFKRNAEVTDLRRVINETA